MLNSGRTRLAPMPPHCKCLLRVCSFIWSCDLLAETRSAWAKHIQGLGSFQKHGLWSWAMLQAAQRLLRIYHIVQRYWCMDSELEGFSLNYNKDMRKELTLREERGKANFMIYNTNFWASYHHFGKWKREHISLLLMATGLTALVNIIVFGFIIWFFSS